MRAILAAAIGLVGMQPGAAPAADFLYTFTGVVTYANNADAPGIYASEGDPIAFSLRVRDDFASVAYLYGPNGSSASGGPDHAPGTLFPVDRTVQIDPSLGYAVEHVPLESGYDPADNHSAAVVKNAAAKSLTIDMRFENFTPPDDGCTERCSGTYIARTASARVFSDAFASPDFRETGSFALSPGSVGSLGDTFATFIPYSDFYELALTQLTVAQLPAAVPEAGTWLMMIAGIGVAGAALRRRPAVRVRMTCA